METESGKAEIPAASGASEAIFLPTPNEKQRTVDSVRSREDIDFCVHYSQT